MALRSRCAAMMTSLAVLSGCAAAPGLNGETAVERYAKFAGPPIPSFTYLGHYEGFKALGGKDLVIWTRFNDAYLIRVLDPCIELPFANAVGLTSTARTVSRGFDQVLVGQDRCRIDTIRHLDTAAMRQAHLS